MDKTIDVTKKIVLLTDLFYGAACSCVAVSLCIHTTVSRGSGLHLLFGLLVTEVTVAMGFWK